LAGHGKTCTEGVDILWAARRAALVGPCGDRLRCVSRQAGRANACSQPSGGPSARAHRRPSAFVRRGHDPKL